jgi:pentatricopeptide repeat protein
MRGAGVEPNVVTYNTLMEGMKSGRERREVLEEMRGAGVEPNVVTYTTVMQGFVSEFDSVVTLLIFNEMVFHHVNPNQHSLSTLFSALVRGLNGDQRSGCLKILEIVSRHVPVHSDHMLLNHFVAGPVLRALASCGSIVDLDAFWSRCQRVLAQSHDGWPGTFLSKQFCDLHARARSSTAGWERLVELCSGAGGGGVAAAANVVCRNWQQRGSCHFGDGCHYKDGHLGLPSGSSGHRGADDGRVAAPFTHLVPRRSVVCNNWERSGYCRFGDGCQYKEGHAVGGGSGSSSSGAGGGHARVTALPAAAASSMHRVAVVCNNWQQLGSCKFGDACRYAQGHR